MGCWLGSCALTNLPIHHGDEIVLIPLFGDAVGHLGRYTFIGLPIVGEYNDYGMIENIQNPEIADVFYKISMEAVDKGYISVEPDNYYCKDGVPVDAEQLLLCIERGLVMDEKRRNYSKTVSEVNFLMMHKEAYDNVIKDAGERIPWDEKYTMRHSYEWTLDNTIEQIQKYPEDSETMFKIIRKQEILEEYPNMPEDELKEMIAKEVDEYDWGAAWNVREKKDRLYQWFAGMDGEGHYFHTNRNIIDIYRKNPTEELRSAIIDHMMIRYVFGVARIPIMPTCGRGSQCSEYKIPEILGEFTTKYIKSRGEDCDYDEDSDYDWKRESANDPKRWM